MKNRVGFAIAGALLGLLGYAIAAIGLAMMAGTEAGPVVLLIALLCSPAAPVVGAVVGAWRCKFGPWQSVFASFISGLLIPLLAFIVMIGASSFSQQKRRVEYRAEGRRAQEDAIARGFPFPKNVQPGMTGQIWCEDGFNETVAFYDRELGRDWTKRIEKSKVWYIRPSKNTGEFDRIWVMTEYGKTSIYFGQLSRADVYKSVANSFAAAAGASNWRAALTYCTPKLRSELGEKGLAQEFKDLKVSSSAYERKQLYNNRFAPIAVNVRIQLGNGWERSGEVGFEFTNDILPSITKLEFIRD